MLILVVRLEIGDFTTDKYEEKLDPLKETTIDKITNHPDIIHAGFQKDIRPYLVMMDVFIFPSYREGFGVSIMEASAMGVPVISSDISGCNEIITDGVNGLLIKPRSSEDLKKVMSFIKKEITIRKKMANQARENVAKKYEQNIVWDAIETYYKKRA